MCETECTQRRGAAREGGPFSAFATPPLHEALGLLEVYPIRRYVLRVEFLTIPFKEYIVNWNVEYTDEFGTWWGSLSDAEQEDISAIAEVLMERGPDLPFPYSSGVEGSRHAHMRELRVQSGGKPLRVFYAFDPRRMAILLIGGDKTGDKRFYKRTIPVADRLYDEHIEELRKERLIR